MELAELESDPGLFAGWLSTQLSAPSDADGVTLASVHAVKGREWPHVVIHHVTDGLLPHRLSPDMEEERRIFHVALTRCRTSASVVPGSPPSPFLLELDAPGTPAPRADRAAAVNETRPRESRGRSAGRPAATPGSAVLPASVGTSFSYQGHDHQVVELNDGGVRARLGGGPATTAVAYGTSVTVDGRAVVLVHGSFTEAFEQLRAWRYERAAGKPAFVVFDDKTLWMIAALLPTTEAGLLAISGIGPVKLENYGDELMVMAEKLRG
jgi:DNA helicase-2/ATP-dependent DNA helicase PcrA